MSPVGVGAQVRPGGLRRYHEAMAGPAAAEPPQGEPSVHRLRGRVRQGGRGWPRAVEAVRGVASTLAGASGRGSRGATSAAALLAALVVIALFLLPCPRGASALCYGLRTLALLVGPVVVLVLAVKARRQARAGTRGTWMATAALALGVVLSLAALLVVLWAIEVLRQGP